MADAILDRIVHDSYTIEIHNDGSDEIHNDGSDYSMREIYGINGNK